MAAKKTTKKTRSTSKKSIKKKAAAQKDTRRDYDAVLFGATGFTGGLVAEVIANAGEIKPNRFALAGRSMQKLEQVRTRMAKIDPKYSNINLLIANIDDQTSMDKLAAATNAVATTVGPYIFYGEPLVKACAKAGTHYADLTGEPEFVDKMFVRYNSEAVKNKAKLVNCCGFDSIPHDAGVYFTLQKMAEQASGDLEQKNISIAGYVSSRGTFSGGTLHSALYAFSRARDYYSWRNDHRNELKISSQRNVVPSKRLLHRVPALKGWGVPLPTIDPQIVRRSAKTLSGYGRKFEYGHYALARKLATGVIGIAGASALFAAVQVPPVLDQLFKIKTPGDGPDAETRAKSRFSVDFIAKSDGGAHMHTRVSGGDPGYSETANMLAASLTCMALGKDLPETAGVLTPMQAMGQDLIDRLQILGLRFDVLD